MNKVLRGLCGLSLALLLITGSLSGNVKAQANDGSFNLVTSPLPINLKAKPGTSVTTDIRVKNGNTTTEKLKVTLMKFTAFGDEGKPGLADRETADDYFDWVSFSPDIFDARPDEWVTVRMTINLSKSAAFGYYYAAVFSRANEPAKPKDKQNVIVGSTAVLVLLDADVPNAKREVNVISFSADKKSYEFLPATFTIKLKNTGNVHVIPTGNIFITRGGKSVATLSVNSASGNILPGSNRIFTTAWDEGFPVYAQKEAGGKVLLDNNGKPSQSLSWDLSKVSKLRFGHYNARLLMAYDDGIRDVPLEANLSFWIVPWRLILMAIAIPVVPSVSVYLIMRWRYKRRAAKAKK